jgi:hypothetical protein
MVGQLLSKSRVHLDYLLIVSNFPPHKQNPTNSPQWCNVECKTRNVHVCGMIGVLGSYNVCIHYLRPLRPLHAHFFKLSQMLGQRSNFPVLT